MKYVTISTAVFGKCIGDNNGSPYIASRWSSAKYYPSVSAAKSDLNTCCAKCNENPVYWSVMSSAEFDNYTKSHRKCVRP